MYPIKDLCNFHALKLIEFQILYKFPLFESSVLADSSRNEYSGRGGKGDS